MNRAAQSVWSVYQSYLRDGKLAYQYSAKAGKPVFYPRVVCPYTGDSELEWRIASGLGTVYSTTVINAKNQDPYNVVLVDCDEGFRLMTRVEGIAADQVKIGMRVRFARTGLDDEDLYPLFEPAEAL